MVCEKVPPSRERKAEKKVYNKETIRLFDRFHFHGFAVVNTLRDRC